MSKARFAAAGVNQARGIDPTLRVIEEAGPTGTLELQAERRWSPPNAGFRKTPMGSQALAQGHHGAALGPGQSPDHASRKPEETCLSDDIR